MTGHRGIDHEAEQRQYDDDVAWLREHGGLPAESSEPDLGWMDRRAGPYPIETRDDKHRLVQRWPTFETVRELDGSLIAVRMVGLQPDTVLDHLRGRTGIVFMGYMLASGYCAGPPVRGLYREAPGQPISVVVRGVSLGRLAATLRALTATAKAWPCRECAETAATLTDALVHARMVHDWTDPGLEPVLAQYGRV